MNTDLQQLLDNYPPHVQHLTHCAHNFLMQVLPDVSEIVDAPAKVIGYGYGSGYKDTICTIILSQKGIKIGLYKGIELPDPAMLLKGTGKVHKYVEIKSEKELQIPAIKVLLENAYHNYLLRR
jgi:hypothetical protein